MASTYKTPLLGPQQLGATNSMSTLAQTNMRAARASASMGFEEA
jgi:hypothetical protein